MKYFDCEISYVFWHVVLISDEIGPWHCNKAYLQVNNIHGKVRVNIDG